MLDVLSACVKNSIDGLGLSRQKDLSKPARPVDWDNMNKDQRKKWGKDVEYVAAYNHKNRAQRLLLVKDIETAEFLREHARFWTPMNLDWRGRVNPQPHFNYTREDRVRALFLFADRLPIGDEGLKWLKVHTANCGSFQDQ